eukprot:scaffold46042_cov75-Attheya_sp.AAC.1
MRASKSAFANALSPDLLPAAGGGYRTVANTGSTTGHTPADACEDGAHSLNTPATPFTQLRDTTLARLPGFDPSTIAYRSPVRFYTFRPQPMGSNLSASTWQPNPVDSTPHPPPLLTTDLEGYHNTNTTTVTTCDILGGLS